MENFQTILADALGMERGEKKANTGLGHRTASEWREERAAEHLVELRGEIARLESELQQKKNEPGLWHKFRKILVDT
jgi:ferritin-like metal-binding protein YciE